ncbi:MAG: hypothetical protein V8S74_06210 [Lachnospirales bacterium]
MEQIKNYETINLTANTVVARECVNISERVYAEVSIINISDTDVLINNTGDFADGKYITLPSGTAINGKKFLNSLILYFKSEADGKVVVNID